MSDQVVIDVWGKPYAIEVIRESSDFWIAVGKYLGEEIRVTGPSRANVIAVWRGTATTKGRPSQG
jgi:hypothetical protein